MGYIITFLCAIADTIFFSGISVYFLLVLHSLEKSEIITALPALSLPFCFVIAGITLSWSSLSDYGPGGLWRKFRED